MKIENKQVGNEKPKVIPEIAEWESDSKESYGLTEESRIIIFTETLRHEAEEFQKDLEKQTGIVLPVLMGAMPQTGDFSFTLESKDETIGEEGYRMQIYDRVQTEGIDPTGIYWATRTILQILKISADGRTMPKGSIRDYPKYKVRGFVLDVGRSPISMEMLKMIAKNMAWYKMNDFQVHLSDNYIFLEDHYQEEKPDPADGYAGYSGYRLESSITNKRGESITSSDYAYSKEEFRTFLQECRQIGVHIVPEIDVPAHALAITKRFPEYAVSDWNPRNQKRSLADHLDITNEKAVELIEQIFDEYILEDIFDKDTVIHIGADEFESSFTAYRNFLNRMLPYIKKTNPVRLWGGLSWIDDHQTKLSKEAVTGTQMNLWNSVWADGIEMYEMGFDLINTLDCYGYLVPNGEKTRGNYGDLIDKQVTFESYAPCRLQRADGSFTEIDGDDPKLLGGAFALWQDYSDGKASGLSEEDLFWRFYDALPLYAEKTWANGNEKGSVETIDALAEQMGTAPGTNPYQLLFSTSDGWRWKEAVGAEVRKDSITLHGGKSYVETSLSALGSLGCATLTFTVKLEEAEPGQIFFERDAAYGTHDIRILANGNLGFTRGLYEYEFAYRPKVGEEVTLTLAAEMYRTVLCVEGFIFAAAGSFLDNGKAKKSGIDKSSFLLPLARIGSASEGIRGTIKQICITATEGVSLKITSCEQQI